MSIANQNGRIAPKFETCVLMMIDLVCLAHPHRTRPPEMPRLTTPSANSPRPVTGQCNATQDILKSIDIVTILANHGGTVARVVRGPCTMNCDHCAIIKEYRPSRATCSYCKIYV